MMSSHSICKSYAKARCAFLCLSLSAIVAGCGGGGSNGSPWEGHAGSAALSIQWHAGRQAEEISPADRESRRFFGAAVPESQPLSSNKTLSDCTQEQVATISCDVYEESGTLLLEGDLWSCDARSGVLDGIPAGENRKFVCRGQDADGNIIHLAQISGIEITADAVTETGVIDSRPFVTLPTTPPDGATLDAGQISLNWDSVPNALRYRVQVALNAEFTEIVIEEWTTQTTFRPSLSPDTTYYWRISAMDAHGHQGAGSVPRRLTTLPGVACTPPTLDPIGNQAAAEGETVAFTVSATAAADPASLTLSAGPLPTGAQFDAATGRFSWNTAMGDAGNYTLRFTACETCEGAPVCADQEIAISVGEVCLPPELDPIGNRQGFEGEYLGFTINAGDPDSDAPLTYRADGLPDGARFNAADRTFSWTPDFGQAGNYDVRFEVCDDCPEGALCDSETVTLTIGNTCRPPVLSPIGPQQIDVGRTLTLRLTANDPDPDDTLTFSASGRFSPFMDGTTGLFEWPPQVEDAGQNFQIEFTVCDNCSPTAQCDSETVNVTVGDICRPPTLNPIGSRDVEVGERLEFTIRATDPDTGDILTYSAAAGDQGLDLTPFFDPGTRTFSWQPTAAQVGTHGLRFEVCDSCIDGALCDAEAITINVASPCRPPVFETEQHYEIPVGELLSFTIRADDPDPDSQLTYRAVELPDGADFSPATQNFSWTPTETGSYEAVFEVCDDCITGSLCDTVTVSIDVTDIDELNYLEIGGDWRTTATESNTYLSQCGHDQVTINGTVEIATENGLIVQAFYSGEQWEFVSLTCELMIHDEEETSPDLTGLDLENPLPESRLDDFCRIFFPDYPSAAMRTFSEEQIQCRFQNPSIEGVIDLTLQR